MKTLYYCRKNNLQIIRLSRTLIDPYQNVKMKEKGCLGKCKICKFKPFILVDGEVIKSKTMKKLSAKIGKHIMKKEAL
jgi:uncharacterized protein YuzB (UPF0349 family)